MKKERAVGRKKVLTHYVIDYVDAKIDAEIAKRALAATGSSLEYPSENLKERFCSHFFFLCDDIHMPTLFWLVRDPKLDFSAEKFSFFHAKIHPPWERPLRNQQDLKSGGLSAGEFAPSV